MCLVQQLLACENFSRYLYTTKEGAVAFRQAATAGRWEIAEQLSNPAVVALWCAAEFENAELVARGEAPARRRLGTLRSLRKEGSVDACHR